MDFLRRRLNRQPDPDDLDGCALDFEAEAISDLEVERMLVAEGDEQDEEDGDGNPAVPGSPDRGIATRLRRGSLILGGGDPLFKVREVDGWKTRGRTTQGEFRPKGSVNHHTAGAGPSAGNAPSLGICVKGRSDLPGPLCHVLQAFDDTAIVVAAGVANHAGPGSWKGLSGNSSVYGLEVEHPGTTRVGLNRELVMASIHACFLWRPAGANIDAGMVSQHREWARSAGTGKIDFAKNFVSDAEADEFRRIVRQQLSKLDQVSRWAVSFLNAEKVRIPKPGDDPPMTRDPSGWVADHMAAMRRGRVSFDPKKG